MVTFGVRPATVYDDGSQATAYPVPAGKSAVDARCERGGREYDQTPDGWALGFEHHSPGVETKDGNQPWSFFNAITPGYFHALGIPIKAGRDLTWMDWSRRDARCVS